MMLWIQKLIVNVAPNRATEAAPLGRGCQSTFIGYALRARHRDDYALAPIARSLPRR